MININGRILEREKTGLAIDNRAFRFGDSLFESIRVSGGRPLFMEDHFSRLIRGMKDFKMENSRQWDLSSFRQEVLKVIEANHFIGGGRLRFTIFRQGEGLYAPSGNDIGYTVDLTSGLPDSFELNGDGFLIGTFSDWPLSANKYSRYKTNNCLPYITAGLYARDNGFDDVLILNTDGNISEAVSSNVFMSIEGILYTPPLSDACVAGIMRKKVIQLSRKLKIAVVESSLSPNMLEKADEVILSNAISGLRWAGSYEKKRYFHKLSVRLTEALNQLL